MGVAVGVWVGVAVGVTVGVAVGVGVNVAVAVAVGVWVGVDDGVNVGARVGIAPVRSQAVTRNENSNSSKATRNVRVWVIIKSSDSCVPTQGTRHATVGNLGANT